MEDETNACCGMARVKQNIFPGSFFTSGTLRILLGFKKKLYQALQPGEQSNDPGNISNSRGTMSKDMGQRIHISKRFRRMSSPPVEGRV